MEIYGEYGFEYNFNKFINKNTTLANLQDFVNLYYSKYGIGKDTTVNLNYIDFMIMLHIAYTNNNMIAFDDLISEVSSDTNAVQYFTIEISGITFKFTYTI